MSWMCLGDNKKSVCPGSFNKYIGTVSDFFGILFHGLQNSEKDFFTSITVEGKTIDVLSFVHRESITAISVHILYMIDGTGTCHLTLGNTLDEFKLDSSPPVIPWMPSGERHNSGGWGQSPSGDDCSREVEEPLSQNGHRLGRLEWA